MDEVRADPLVRQVLERFPGAEIVERARARRRAGGDAAIAGASSIATIGGTRRTRSERCAIFMGMMKQAKELQEKMQSLQAEIAALEATGSVGRRPGHGHGRRQGRPEGVKIDPSLAKPDEIEILEDLIVAAARDARGKADAAAQAKMQSLTAGLPLPPGLNLPF